MMSDFLGGLGGSSKIGQNWTRGIGSLADIGHPIILVFLQFFYNRCYDFFHNFLTKSIFFSEKSLPKNAICTVPI